MFKVIVTTLSGEKTAIEAAEGRSVMECIRNAGLDGLLMLCGGVCSCATCHVIVDDAWTRAVGVPSDEEDALLDGVAHRTPTSRLSCQIKMSPDLDGVHVTIPPEE